MDLTIDPSFDNIYQPPHIRDYPQFNELDTAEKINKYNADMKSKYGQPNKTLPNLSTIDHNRLSQKEKDMLRRDIEDLKRLDTKELFTDRIDALHTALLTDITFDLSFRIQKLREIILNSEKHHHLSQSDVDYFSTYDTLGNQPYNLQPESLDYSYNQTIKNEVAENINQVKDPRQREIFQKKLNEITDKYNPMPNKQLSLRLLQAKVNDELVNQRYKPQDSTQSGGYYQLYQIYKQKYLGLKKQHSLI